MNRFTDNAPAEPTSQARAQADELLVGYNQACKTPDGYHFSPTFPWTDRVRDALARVLECQTTANAPAPSTEDWKLLQALPANARQLARARPTLGVAQKLADVLAAAPVTADSEPEASETSGAWEGAAVSQN